MSEAAAIMGREAARSLGAQFTAARERRGLSLEQVSSEMHIRVQRLREIENDDYSQFSHPSYARMYAIDYAKYLGIPVSRIRRLLPDRGVCGSGGYQYLQETACDYMRSNAGRHRRLLPKLITAGLLVLFSLSGVKLWVILRDIERLGLNRVAGGDQPAIVVPETQSAVSTTDVTPESSSGPVGTKPEQAEDPAAENPVRGSTSSDAESALLVGADLDQSDPIR
jgi:cytoskeletal protein RodZ